MVLIHFDVWNWQTGIIILIYMLKDLKEKKSAYRNVIVYWELNIMEENKRYYIQVEN